MGVELLAMGMNQASGGDSDVLVRCVLAAGDAALERRILGRLLDSMSLDLRDRYVAGEVDDQAYQAAILDLSNQARTAGLEPAG